jgi:hypothetical protein
MALAGLVAAGAVALAGFVAACEDAAAGAVPAGEAPELCDWAAAWVVEFE